jgi:release factor glutamine methyltransferase
MMDISSGALDMARKNATHNGVNARFILGDITKEMPNEKFDIITANPPYIPSCDIEGLSEEVKKEPILALDGGDDGLDFVRFLLGYGVSYLNDGGKMLIEFGYDQEKEIKSLAHECENISSYEILYDYSSNPRVLVIYK